MSGFWRTCRVTVRWCRRTVLLLVLLLIGAVLWLNHVGLPDFVKTRLVTALREEGVQLDFSRLRLNFLRGLIADNVHIGGAQVGQPSLELKEAQVQLDFAALLHRHLRVSGLNLRQGHLVWPLPERADGSARELTLERIETALHFETNDTWTLNDFRAEFAGAKLMLSGEVAHAPELRDWELFQAKPHAATNAPVKFDEDVRAKLVQFADLMDEIHFIGTPQLSLAVNGDARDIHSFKVHLIVAAPDAQTPWGSGRDVQLIATLTAPVDEPTNINPAWAWWTNAQPYRLDVKLQLTRFRSVSLDLDSLSFVGHWAAPELAVDDLRVALAGGSMAAKGHLDVDTRKLSFTNNASFEFHALGGLLPEEIRKQLADCSWLRPPALAIGGSLTLPAWTNRAPDWFGEVQPTLQVSGSLAVTNGGFMGVGFDEARLRFYYGKRLLEVSDLQVVQDQTRLNVDGLLNDQTAEFDCHVRGQFDVNQLRPYMPADDPEHGFQRLTFAQPLHLDVAAQGQIGNWDALAANGHIALTNASWRDLRVGDLTTSLNYSNRVLEFSNPILHIGPQMMVADKITLDFDRQQIRFTNGWSTADPQSVAFAIGPKTAELMESYHFITPPGVRVNGTVPLRNIHKVTDAMDADLRFDIVQGAPFQWARLRTSKIEGTIHWLGAQLFLTNLTASAYGGNEQGGAAFDFSIPGDGANYTFFANVTNVDLHLLTADLADSPTNHLEGTLTGFVNVTHANSEDWRTWQGFGQAQLRDGLIWDVPVFGILSPILNGVSPGLGSSRATGATARYTITNGVIYTDSLEIRSTMMRLQYVGTVDLMQNVNARVTAQPLRDTWVVGDLVSTVLWPVSKLFEYKVTGTLSEPKPEPVYVPKLLFAPLHPFKTIQEILPFSGLGSTNAPSADPLQ